MSADRLPEVKECYFRTTSIEQLASAQVSPNEPCLPKDVCKYINTLTPSVGHLIVSVIPILTPFSVGQ